MKTERGPKPKPVAERFWAKVHKTDSCWLWTASLTFGYGSFWDGKGQVRAHRFAYELLVDPIPEGLQLDHLCRIRHCVNPDHLEAVTNAENVQRGVVAKLNWTLVREIRAAHRTGETGKSLAARFGVSEMTISYVVRGVVWAEDDASLYARDEGRAA